MIHIDSKITTWQRFSMDDEHSGALVEFLQQNPHATVSDIAMWAVDNGIEGDHEDLADTEVEMTPEENGGEATLKVVVEQSNGETTTLHTNADRPTPNEHI